jgi:hypothetical protein
MNKSILKKRKAKGAKATFERVSWMIKVSYLFDTKRNMFFSPERGLPVRATLFLERRTKLWLSKKKATAEKQSLWGRGIVEMVF